MCCWLHPWAKHHEKWHLSFPKTMYIFSLCIQFLYKAFKHTHTHTQRETDRQRDRETERERDRHTHRERERERERETPDQLVVETDTRWHGYN